MRSTEMNSVGAFIVRFLRFSAESCSPTDTTSVGSLSFSLIGDQYHVCSSPNF
jgi:hypothetical protein